jgi:hypothetical protein
LSRIKQWITVNNKKQLWNHVKKSIFAGWIRTFYVKKEILRDFFCNRCPVFFQFCGRKGSLETNVWLCYILLFLEDLVQKKLNPRLIGLNFFFFENLEFQNFKKIAQKHNFQSFHKDFSPLEKFKKEWNLKNRSKALILKYLCSNHFLSFLIEPFTNRKSSCKFRYGIIHHHFELALELN